MGSAISKPAASTTPSTMIEKSSYKPTTTDHQVSFSNRSGRAEAIITLPALSSWDNAAFSLPTSKLAHLTLHNAALPTSLHHRTAEIFNQHVFSHTIPFEGSPVTNQKSSGRCWLFATTNVIRVSVSQALNLKDFELSQSYLSFYDKLEKSNYFLENMIELADRPLDERVVGFLKTAPTNDGGQWDMVSNLLSKYGVVPKSIYPESFNSSNSSKVNWLCTLKLREFTLELREIQNVLEERLSHFAVEERKATILTAQRQRKDEQMEEIYRIMAISLGAPPKPDEEFTFNYKDKNDKFHSLKSTPKDFLRDYTGSFDHKARCSLVHDPRHEADKLITIDRLGNVWGGNPVSYVNTTIKVMRQAVVQSIKAGHPVFFGCDVSQFSDTASGIMDPCLFGYDLAFNITLGLTKAQRIELGESSMTHAMVITGVHIQDGKVTRYRVENSWGEENVGDKGYMVMSDKWFKEYNFQVVVAKEFVPKNLWKLFEKRVDEETIVLPPYDPLGALA